MAVNQDNAFWRGFINLYRALPELWQVKNDVYRDRYKKTLAYEKLIDYLKAKDKNVNKELVKRKLNTLRGSYRRERKKVENWKPTARVEERYVSSLWYYDDLDAFLNDQEIGTDEGISFSENTNDNTSCSFNERQPKRKKATHKIEEPKETTTTVTCDFKNVTDCSEIYGMAWAAQFRQLAPDQQIHAKRAMDEILYQGMLGNLPQTQSTYSQCSKPTHSSLPTPRPHYSTTFSTSWEEVEDCKFGLPTLQIPLDEGHHDINNPLTKEEVD